MVVIDIMSCIKVTKENDSGGMDIDLGTKVRIIDYEGNTIVGKVLHL